MKKKMKSKVKPSSKAKSVVKANKSRLGLAKKNQSKKTSAKKQSLKIKKTTVKQKTKKPAKKPIKKAVLKTKPKKTAPSKKKVTKPVKQKVASIKKPSKIRKKSSSPKAVKPTKRKLIKKPMQKPEIVKQPLQHKPYVKKNDEEYMNQTQLDHFKNLLVKWKEELLHGAETTVQDMQTTSANFPDPVDRASQEEEFNLELRARDRERKLLKKIAEALQRIKENNYGYCDDCGAEIGIKRLEARPTATQCIECKTIAEIREKQLGDIGREKEEE